MAGDRMAKRSIGSLMRKKLSDITNSQLQDQTIFPTQEENPLHTSSTDRDCIQQLLKERVTLMQLLAEKNKMIEWSRAEMQMMRSNFQKLQLQNLNLAQSNSHMLAELNLGREKIKALQHEILWKAALLKGNYAEEEVVGKVEMDFKSNGSMSQQQEGDEKAGQPSPNASNRKQSKNMNRRRSTKHRSTSSSTTASTKNARKEKAEDKRHCARLETNKLKPLEDLFEIEDAKYPVIQSRPYLLGSRAVKDETGYNSASRNEALSSSFGRPLRKSVEKGQSSYKDTNSSKSLSAKTRASIIN